jgi:hypothetical protein
MPKNIRILLVSFLVLFVCFSCQQSTQDKAPIEGKKLAAILRDLHTAEAYSSLLAKDTLYRQYNGKNIDSLAIFYKQILAKHQVTMATIDSALKWYSLHPQDLDSVYAEVLPTFDSLKTLK